jgi:hypothetical protein
VLFGTGLRLFDAVDPSRISLEITEAMHSPLVTHLNYAVRRRGIPADTAQEQAVSASGR